MKLIVSYARKLTGYVLRVSGLSYISYLAHMQVLQFIYFRPLFKGKRVAIVGSSPNLTGTNLGTEIDSHDVVIRINLLQLSELDYDYGSKTDVRFIGATLLEKHVDLLNNIPPDVVMITTTKNLKAFQRTSRKVVFFPKVMPLNFIKKIDNIFDAAILNDKIKKPPRSGVICALLLVFYSKPALVSLYGFSTSLQDAGYTINSFTKRPESYESALLSRNHCDPAIELKIISYLVIAGLVKIPTDSKC